MDTVFPVSLFGTRRAYVKFIHLYAYHEYKAAAGEWAHPLRMINIFITNKTSLQGNLLKLVQHVNTDSDQRQGLRVLQRFRLALCALDGATRSINSTADNQSQSL